MSKTDLAVYSTLPNLAKLKDADPKLLANINNAFEAMSGDIVGMEEMDISWKPEYIKIKHPVSDDAACPQDAVAGDIYTTGGNLVWRCRKDLDNPFQFVPVYGWTSNVRFPAGQRSSDCYSNDGKWNAEGTLMCKDCPDEPFKNGQKQACQKTLNFIIIPLDCSGVYQVSFAKSNYRAGSTIMKSLRGVNPSWHRVFALSTHELTAGTNRYHAFKSAPYSSAEIPPELDIFASFVHAEFTTIRKSLLASEEQRRKDADEILSQSVTATVLDAGGANDFADSM